MRIMFVIPSMNNGGAERVVTNLSNYFCKKNVVRIVTLVSGRPYYELDKKIEFCSQPLQINRKNIFTTFSCYSKYFLKAKKFIKKNIEEFRPDCVISFLVEADYLTYLAMKNNKNIVKVFSERADPIRRKRIRQVLAKRAYKICDLFVCQSQKIKNYYSYIPENKKVVIPNPLDVSVLPEPVLKEGNHNIVSVGRLSNQKNYKLLIKSFILSIDELPEDCNLIIYGDGPLKSELQKYIDDNEMSHKIKLAGTSKDVLGEIKDAALFVLPSDFEGFPNVLLEAMAVGLPVISTDFYTGVANELIKKENGLVVPLNDERRMSDAIIEIMNNKNKRESMRKKNIIVHDKYNIEMIGNLWIEYMKKAMERI